MGQKVNPIGLRLGINRTWDSRWYARAEYGDTLQSDLALRAFLENQLRDASVSRIIIERSAKLMIVKIITARPGIVIGKKGAGLDQLNKRVRKLLPDDMQVRIQVTENRRAELDAKLVANNVAQQLEKRISYRRAMKRAVQTSMRMGAEGIRINCGGRLGGAEIARTEWYREGRVPLHTLRADIDYALAEAHTTYGVCGVKVWIYRGEILEKDTSFHEKRFTDLR